MRSLRTCARIMAGCFAVLFTLFTLTHPSAWALLGRQKPPKNFTAAKQIPACVSPRDATLPAHPEKLLDRIVIVQNGDTIGSGVVISPNGHILTAAHLLGDTASAAVYLNSGEVETGQVLQRNRDQDIALIKIPRYTPHCLRLRTQWLPSGSPVYGVGFSTGQGGQFYFSQGIVLGYHQAGNHAPVYLETDMDLWQGSSGGPFLDGQGQVAGIISWKRKTSPQSVHSFGVMSLFIRHGIQLSRK